MTLELLSTAVSQTLSPEDERIRLLESMDDEIHPFALQNLKEQYNQLVGIQVERRREPLPDPIEHLPPEIWLQIFKDVGSGHQDGDDSNPIDHLFLASLVSPKWRDAILNTPEIWTEVTVDPASTSWEDDLFKLHAAMYFSGKGLLTLILRLSSYNQWEGENGAHRIISNHGRRIRRIVFGNGNLPYEAVNTILLSLGPLPLLRAVQTVKELAWRLLSWDDFFLNAPALASSNIVLPVDVLRGDLINSCREISIWHSLGDISTYLVKFQPLTSLSCWGGIHLPGYPQPCLDSFRALEEFNYYQSDMRLVLSILQVTVKLTTLSISVGSSWNILTGLLQACHLLHSLFSLDIELVYLPNPGDITLSEPAGPLMVRTLVIRYIKPVELPDKRSIPLGCRRIARLADVLHLCTPAVEEFYFHTGIMDYLPFKYISSRTHLLRLTLSLPELTSIPDDMLIQSKSLACLSLDVNTTLLSIFFRGLECPNLHRIVFLPDREYHGPSEPSSIVTLDSTAFPQLASIEWRDQPVFWQITSLQTLRKLVLPEWSQEVVSELCLHFIMRPHDCPSLEYIEFRLIPEWDLLFMMLERRNHSTRSDVSRITTLVFPARIPYNLLAPMTELLNGRFVTGLSYHDVSISSIAEFYFDASITGCTFCLLSMNSCTREVIPNGAFVDKWSRPKYPTPIAANPRLSAEMSGWLDGREERDRNWDAKDTEWRQRHISRSPCCHFLTLSKRMFVTGSTLKGIHTAVADLGD